MKKEVLFLFLKNKSNIFNSEQKYTTNYEYL